MVDPDGVVEETGHPPHHSEETTCRRRSGPRHRQVERHGPVSLPKLRSSPIIGAKLNWFDGGVVWPARERNEMLGSTGRALETSKSSMKPTAVQESLDGGADHSSKRTRLGFESLLVGIDVIVEVLFEQLVKGGSLWVPGSVHGG